MILMLMVAAFRKLANPVQQSFTLPYPCEDAGQVLVTDT